MTPPQWQQDAPPPRHVGWPQQQDAPQQPAFHPGYSGQPGPPGWYPPLQQPPAPPQAPKKSRKGLAFLGCGGLGALVAVIVVVSVAMNSGHSVQTTGTSPGAGAPDSTQKTAKIGTSITLSGNDSGEQMSVEVTKVIVSATPSDEFNQPPAGDRLYAVQFRLSDTGSAAYSDSPSNGAAVVDSAGQSYQSGLETVTGCHSFGGTENIAPGSSGLGCIVFEVPKAAKITQVQFTLDSGLGPQTGQWSVG